MSQNSPYNLANNLKKLVASYQETPHGPLIRTNPSKQVSESEQLGNKKESNQNEYSTNFIYKNKANCTVYASSIISTSGTILKTMDTSSIYHKEPSIAN